MNNLQSFFLKDVENFISGLEIKDQAKIASLVKSLEQNNFNILYVKNLHSPIKELRVKSYRFIFFTKESSIYFIHAFIKKSNKTPKKELDYSNKIYKLFIKTI